MKVYSYSAGNGNVFISAFEVEKFPGYPGMTTVPPTAQMLEAIEDGFGRCVSFNEEKQKWEMPQIPVESIEEEIRTARGEIADYADVPFRDVRIPIREWKKLQKHVLFLTVDRTAKIVTKIMDSDGRSFYVSTPSDVLELMGLIIDKYEVIDMASDVLVHGGTVGGVEIKPLSKYTSSERVKFVASDAMYQTIDLIESERK